MGKHSWNVFVLNFDVFMRVVCVMQMTPSTLDESRRLPRIERYIGATGPALFGLLEWTHTWRMSPSNSSAECSFAGLVRAAFFGYGRQDTASTVTTYLTYIGQTICLARNTNPSKVDGSTKFIPQLSQMIDGFRKEDPPVRKKLPVEVDVLELLCTFGLMEKATAKKSTVGDLTLLAFYFLWQVGEYTMKNTRNNSKQTTQFALKDVLFFRSNAKGQLRQLSSRRASDEEILESVGVPFLLRNQKNGWKNVCVHHEANGDPKLCPVKAAACRFIHIGAHMNEDWDTFFSAYFDEDGRRRVPEVSLVSLK